MDPVCYAPLSPPSTQSAKEASSVVLSLCVSASSLDTVYLHQLLLPPCIPLLLPPHSARHRYMQDIYASTERHARALTQQWKPSLHLGSKNHKTCQGINPLIFYNFIYINPLLHACSPATIPLTGKRRGENAVRRGKRRKRANKWDVCMIRESDWTGRDWAKRERSERVKDEWRICRGLKSFFVLDALETADIATIRPSFRGKEPSASVSKERARVGFSTFGILICL